MDFDLDDPLADILSGGSDDSFFDDDVLGRKKTSKKSTPLASKKSALFNLDDDIKPSTSAPAAAQEETKKDNTTGQSLELLHKPVPREAANSATREQIKITGQLNYLDESLAAPKQKLSSLERINSLERIGTAKVDKTHQPGKTVEKRKSSISLLDDILGSSTTRTPTKIKAPQTSKSQDFDIEALLGNKPIVDIRKKPVTPMTVPITPTAAPIKPSTATSKTSVQSEIKKSEGYTKTVAPPKPVGGDNWLGIFGEKESETKKVSTDDSGMPAWLVGKENKTKSKAKDSVPKTPENQREFPKVTPQTEERQSLSLKESMGDISKAPEFSRSAVTIQGLASAEDITQEGAALYMQQQEAQLMIALQLKAQEEKLAAMQMRQEDSKKIQQQAAAAQQSQLAGLLARQAEHRRQMQGIISAHQERINDRIKALLTTPNLETDAEEPGGGGGGDPDAPAARKEAPHERERRQLLQLVATLQENHEKEIDLMETSYRRQLAISDASLQQSEERMRAESGRIALLYVERIEWLERQQKAQRALAEEAARGAEERHGEEMREARERGAENVRVLREQHAALVENIKDSVQQERRLVHDWASISGELAALMAEVRSGGARAQQLVDAVQASHDRDALERDKALAARETHVAEMLQNLTKERDCFEKEKMEDREKMKLLEGRLKQMTQSAEEEVSSMKQRRMEFEFEKATFNKQTEFAKNVLKKQEEEIKVIKEEIQKEYQEKRAKIEEEKNHSQKDAAIVTREKIAAQNLRLDLEKLKAELQSQMEQVSEERSRVALEKQQLQMEEQRIFAKSRDLDMLSKSALEKQSLADRKYSEAEYIQRKYEDRVRRIQEHAIALNAREQTIARDKVALSRERLALHNERKQVESRQQCSLCRSLQNPIINISDHAVPNNYPANIPNEPHLHPEYLSMGVSRDYADVGGNVDALEQEMTNLLMQNITSRDAKGYGDENNDGQHSEHNSESRVTSAYKGAADPKLMLLRLDVQQVISNLAGPPPPPPLC